MGNIIFIFYKGFLRHIYIHYIHWEPGYLWSGKTTLKIFKVYLIFKQSLFKSEMVCVQCTIALFHLHLTIKYHQLSLKTSSYSRVFTVNLQSVLCEYFGWMLEHEANGYCIFKNMNFSEIILNLQKLIYSMFIRNNERIRICLILRKVRL